jgi:hypothetical protein
MTTNWCAAPEELDDADLRLLLQAAASVLAEAAEDEDEAADMVEMPASEAAAEVGATMGSAGGAARRLVDDPAADRALALELVREVCAIPALRDEVDEAYAARKRMLVVDPGSILAVSLLLLVVKLRRVKVGREGVQVELDPIREGALKFAAKLLGAQ